MRNFKQLLEKDPLLQELFLEDVEFFAESSELYLESSGDLLEECGITVDYEWESDTEDKFVFAVTHLGVTTHYIFDASVEDFGMTRVKLVEAWLEY